MSDFDTKAIERLVEIRRAEMNQTADQAVEQARAAAARTNQQGRFDATMAELLRVFDLTAGDARWSGMTLDEAGYFDQWMLGDLTQHWVEMQIAFGQADRVQYRKAAAAFTERAIEFAAGVRS